MDAGRARGARRRAAGSPARRCARRSTPTAATACSPWSRPRARRTSAWSTTSPAWRRSAASAGCGCTSTAPTASPRCARRARATASPGSSTRTRSSSIRTSGCSRRSTAARCSTASRRSAAPPTRQHASYLEALYVDDDAFNPSDYGVHLTRRARGLPFWFALAVHGTDAFADGGRDDARAHPRGGRGDPGARRAGAADRARAVGARVPPPRLGSRGLRPLGAPRCARPARRSSMPTTVGGETVARLALVNPRTTLDDLGRARRDGGVNRTIGRWSTSFQDIAEWSILTDMTHPPLTTGSRARLSARSWRRSATAHAPA